MARRSEFDQHTFTVEGSGNFPFDMLRYDNCWPYREAEDSSALRQDYNDLDNPPQRRRVTLATRNRHAPKLERWSSFGWKVVDGGTP